MNSNYTNLIDWCINFLRDIKANETLTQARAKIVSCEKNGASARGGAHKNEVTMTSLS